MKKMDFVAGMLTTGLVGLTAYTLLNKNTKYKADRLINNFLDKANNMTDKCNMK